MERFVVVAGELFVADVNVKENADGEPVDAAGEILQKPIPAELLIVEDVPLSKDAAKLFRVQHFADSVAALIGGRVVAISL